MGRLGSLLSAHGDKSCEAPLTPTLSRREREDVPPSCCEGSFIECSQGLPAMIYRAEFPLSSGRGERGEGEFAPRPTRKDTIL